MWLNRQQIAELFGRDIKTIGKHINNALKEELANFLVVANFATTKKYGRREGFVQVVEVEYYNLDVIISVGYRVKSSQGIQFRQWANKVLKEYLVSKKSHDRFLIIDDKVYHVGASIKDLGKKLCAVMQMNFITPEEIMGKVKP